MPQTRTQTDADPIPRSEPRRKRHHYLPQTYLTSWADQDGRVAGRRRRRPAPFVAAPVNVAVEANLYTLYYGQQADDSLEVAFSEVEADLPQLLENLRRKRPPKRGTPERHQIAQLLALQFVRTPAMIEQIMFAEAARDATNQSPITHEAMRKYLTKVWGETPADRAVQGACDFANYGAYENGPFSKQEGIEMLLHIALGKLTQTFAAKGWRVEVSHQGRFMTSDRPLVTWNRHQSKFSGIGFTDAHEIRFALGPNHLLVLGRGTDDRYVVPPERARDVNRTLAHACHQLVVGHPDDRDELAGFMLREVGPSLRFNTGPAYQVGPEGESVATGSEVLHMYVPPDDGWLDRSPS